MRANKFAKQVICHDAKSHFQERWHGKGVERLKVWVCERWFWIHIIWVGREKAVEREKRGILRGVRWRKTCWRGDKRRRMKVSWMQERRKGTRYFPPVSHVLWSAVKYSPPCLISADLKCFLFYLGVVCFPHLSLMFTLTSSTSLLSALVSLYFNLISLCLRSVFSHCELLHK